MAIDRRVFLLGCASNIVAGVPVAEAGSRGAMYAAARRGADGAYSAAIFTSDGQDVRAVALPDRGHDLTVCPVTRRCVVFARRPGNFAIVFSVDQAAPPIPFTTPEDRHFYGHGVFSRDGRLLYATENDFEGARGVIGIYDATAGFERVGEFPSYGLGPHDLALLRGQPVLVIANGGLREHPDLGGGRRVLNPDAIETSIAYVDIRNGDLVERHDFKIGGRLSLRHLDVGQGNTVVIGAQVEGPAVPEGSLIFRHRRQEALTAVTLPGDLAGRFSGYVSSVAVDSSGEVAAITSSRGNLATLIDIRTGHVLRTMSCAEVSGISPTPAAKAFLATTGHGGVTGLSPDTETDQCDRGPWKWDNHAVMLADA